MMMLTWLLLPLLMGDVAAQSLEDDIFQDLGDDAFEDVEEGEAVVFVAPFQSKNREATGLAGMMSSFLESQLDRHPDLRVVYLDEIPPVHDMAVDVYLDSCPPGQSVGCAYVVAEGAQANFALTGSVLAQPEGTQVEISIIDVRASREVLSFAVSLGAGEDERFAEGVAGVLVSVVRGEAGRVEDIREMGDDRQTDYSAAAAQLAQLTREIGDVTTLQVRKSTQIERPKLTSQDIADRMQTEGVKPWERLDMSAEQYLQYKNSGLNLMDWRERFSGRTLQLIVRTGVGVARGPVDTRYEALYARGVTEADTFATEEVYAWQSQLSGTGLLSSLQVGMGVTPVIEVGAQIGYGRGLFTISTASKVKTQDHSTAPPKEREYANSNLYMGPYVLAGLMPAKNIRPVVGLGVLYWQGSDTTTKEELFVDLPVFDKPKIWLMEAKGGVEARLSKNVDFFVHVPLLAVIAGDDTVTMHTGKNCTVEKEDAPNEPCLETTRKPPGVGPLGAGALVGLQFRMLGKKHEESTRVRDYELDDF